MCWFQKLVIWWPLQRRLPDNARYPMAAMVYTLSMTSDVALFTATIRGGHGNQKLAKARKCHGLKIMDGVMDLPRKPSDAEHEAVLGRLTSALGAMPSDTDVQTLLGAELVAAIAAMKSTSASAPSPRRTVAEPRKLAAGPGSALGAYELKFASEHWRLHHPSWSGGVTVNHNHKASVREQHRVRELLGRLLAAYLLRPDVPRCTLFLNKPGLAVRFYRFLLSGSTPWIWRAARAHCGEGSGIPYCLRALSARVGAT